MSTLMHEKPLTAKERRVLDLIKEGMSNQAIADEMQLSINTIKTHVKNIFRKLKVNSRTQACVYTDNKILTNDEIFGNE